MVIKGNFLAGLWIGLLFLISISSNFSRHPAFDLEGQYVPVRKIINHNYQFQFLEIGNKQHFSSFEKGRLSEAPFRMFFLGPEKKKLIKIRPLSYELTADSIKFKGVGSLIGLVKLEGKIDRKSKSVLATMNFKGQDFENLKIKAMEE